MAFRGPKESDKHAAPRNLQELETWDSHDESLATDDSFMPGDSADRSPDANCADAHSADDSGAPSAPRAETLGRYELREELGRGGMGVVYRARDQELGRDVALKAILAGVHASAASRRRFMREARAVARLRHANIVQIFDIGVHADTAFFTMELVVGPSLAAYTRTAQLDPRQAAALVGTLARALAYAHEQGLVHRDVKPGNVLLDTTEAEDSSPDAGRAVPALGRLVLTDFGLVKDVATDNDTAALTRAGAVVGTPMYMAPEQLLGDIDAIGAHSDQFALGVMLWELASGSLPYADTSPAELVKRAVHHEPLALDDRSVPAPLRHICDKALSRAPRERYRDCVALADDLDRFLAGAPVLAASRGPLWHARRFVRRYRRALAVMCLIALGAVAAAWSLRTLADWRATRAENARQAAAEERRIAMQTRIDALVPEASDEPAMEPAMAAADRAFEGFTKLKHNAETHALARAWLDRAALLRRLSRTATDERAVAARAAYGTAYGLSEARDEQAAALLGLAALFRAAYDWDGAGQALAALARRAPDVFAAHPVALRLRRDQALAERRLADAAALVGDRSAPGERSDAQLLDRLARATRTQHRARVGALWDMDRDGAPELVFTTDERQPLTVVGLDNAALPVRAQLVVPDESRNILRLLPLSRPATEPPMLLVATRTRSQILRLADGQLEQATAPLGTDFFSVASGDLDGDGALEHYGAQVTQILSLRPQEDGALTVEDALPFRTVSSTYVRDIAIADLDRDGRSELIAATSEWGSYDVRAYHATGRGLELVARHQLGEVVQVEIVRAPGEMRAAVIQEHDPSVPLNRRVFADDTPHGAARGIHLLALTASGWKWRTSIPLQHPLLWPRGRSELQLDVWPHLLAGDLDGDGLDDLVATYQDTWMFVYHQRVDGTFTELMIDGTAALAIRDIDGDGAAELIVRTADTAAEISVLGMGDERMPATEPDLSAYFSYNTGPVAAAGSSVATDIESDIERDIEPALRQDWQRAEELAAMGLEELAAERFEQIAALAAGTATEVHALYQAGQAMETIGRRHDSLRLSTETPLADASGFYRRAAAAASAKGSSARALDTWLVRAWDAALRCDLAGRRHAAALEAANARLSLPEPTPDLPGTVTGLKAALAMQPMAFDFNAGLDPQWRVHRPFDVRLDRRAGGLRVRTVGDAPLLSLHLRRTGGPIRVMLDVSVERTDWAGVFYLALIPGRDVPRSIPRIHSRDSVTVVRWQTMGGGRAFIEQIRCGRTRPDQRPRAEAPEHRHRRLVWEFSSADGSESCKLTLGDDILRATQHADSEQETFKVLTLPDEVTLVIGGGGIGGTIATAESLLRRLELVGFEIAPIAATPVARAHHQLAVGRPDRALAALDDAADRTVDRASTERSVASAVTRAVALHELERERESQRVLTAALAREPDLDGLFVPLVRHHLDRFEPAVRTALGHRYYLRFMELHDATLAQHPYDERGIAPLVTHLKGLEAVAFDTFREPDDALVHLTLLASRGAAWYRNDQAVLAHRDLSRAEAFAGYLLSSPARAADREFSAAVRRELGRARLNLAPLYVEWGERDRAIATLLEALAASPEPEVLADQIAIHDKLADLRTHPRWPEVLRARKIDR